MVLLLPSALPVKGTLMRSVSRLPSYSLPSSAFVLGAAQWSLQQPSARCQHLCSAAACVPDVACLRGNIHALVARCARHRSSAHCIRGGCAHFLNALAQPFSVPIAVIGSAIIVMLTAASSDTIVGRGRCPLARGRKCRRYWLEQRLHPPAVQLPRRRKCRWEVARKLRLSPSLSRG